MQIIYNQNPLATQIILDDHEKKELLYKIQIEHLKDLLFDAHFFLDKDLERTKEALDPKNYYDDNCEFEKSCQHIFDYCIEELNREHAGDCTAIACSCSKCYVEQLLEIDTIKSMTKSTGSIIQGAFKKNETIEDALNYLQVREFDSKSTYIEIYKKQRITAIEWLQAYKTLYLEKH
jgi:hypothetical protein